MQFQSKDEAQHFFNFYAYLVGFKTAVAHVFRTSSRKINNEVTKVTIKCNKFGKDELPKTIDQQEAATDKDIGKKGSKKTNKCHIKNKLPMCSGYQRSRRHLEDYQARFRAQS